MLKRFARSEKFLALVVVGVLLVGAMAHAQDEQWREIYHRGQDFQAAGLYNEAVSAYKQAIAEAPNEYYLYNDLGEAYILMNQFSAAIDAFRQALALNPNDPTVHTNLGIAYDSLGEYDMALLEHKKALEIDPNHPTAHNNLGHVYEQTGRFDEAVAEYKKAIVINTNFLLAQVNLGNVLVKKGMFEEGVAAHSRAVEIAPKNASAYNNLAHAYYKLGDYEKAIANLRKALELDPANETVRSNLEFLTSEYAAAPEGAPVTPAQPQVEQPAVVEQTPAQTTEITQVPIEALPPSSQVLDTRPDQVTEIIVGRTHAEPAEIPVTIEPATQTQEETAQAEAQTQSAPVSSGGPEMAKPTQEEELYYAGIVPGNKKNRKELLFGPMKESWQQGGGEGTQAGEAAAGPAPVSAPARPAAYASTGPGVAVSLLPPAQRFQGTTFVEVPDPIMRRRVLVIPFDEPKGYENWKPSPAEMLTEQVELALRDSGQFRVTVAKPGEFDINRIQDDDLTRIADEHNTDVLVMGRIADHGIYYQNKKASFGIKDKNITEARTLLIIRVEDALNDKSYASESILGMSEREGKIPYVDEFDMLEDSIEACSRDLVIQLVKLLHLD